MPIPPNPRLGSAWPLADDEAESILIEAFADEEQEITEELPAEIHHQPLTTKSIPWRGGRRPPWAAVLPAPEPVMQAGVDAILMEVPLSAVRTPACCKVEPQAEPARATVRPVSQPASPEPPIVAAPTIAAPPPGMVAVPKRVVRRGADSFTVEPYFLDRDLVTQLDWSRFLKAKGGASPRGWRDRRPPADDALLPMTDITFAEARAYAAWRGVRLPTVAEWLAAAAGLSWFPHGMEICPVGLCQCPRAGMPRAPSPVGTHPKSNSDDGARDLLGNVWEWVDEDTRLPGLDAEHAWAMGGSYKHVCPGPDPASRRVPQTMIHHQKTWPYLGFRCAWSAT